MALMAASGAHEEFSFGALGFSILLVVVNGIFVAAEFSLLASTRGRVEELAEGGAATARVALRSMASLGTTLAGTQLGVTIASLALGSVAEPAIGAVFSSLFTTLRVPSGVISGLSLVFALSVVVFMHLLIGEMIPKSVALSAPERTLLALVIPIRGFVMIFRPVIWMLNQMARGIVKLFGVTPADELRSAHTAAEISVMLEESQREGLIEDDEQTMLAGALAFVERSVADVMVPRDRIRSVAATESVANVEEVIRETGHSRVLVDGARPGSLAGFVHVKDLLALSDDEQAGTLPRSLIRLTFSVSCTEELGPLLVRMRATQRHLAIVIDDQRTAIGLVTLEDIIESIVGDIFDETDQLSEAPRTDGS